jgi:hypothetical protein
VGSEAGVSAVEDDLKLICGASRVVEGVLEVSDNDDELSLASS